LDSIEEGGVKETPSLNLRLIGTKKLREPKKHKERRWGMKGTKQQGQSGIFPGLALGEHEPDGSKTVKRVARGISKIRGEGTREDKTPTMEAEMANPY